MTIKKRGEHANVRQESIQDNKTIHQLCNNYKLSAVIFTKNPYIINGFDRKSLKINRQSFRIEKHGLRHASGTFFRLSRKNLNTAKQFLCSEVA